MATAPDDATMDGRPGMDTHEPDAMAADGQAAPRAYFYAAIILGVRLITIPFALDYRSSPLTWSDVIIGTLVIVRTVTLLHGSVWGLGRMHPLT